MEFELLPGDDDGWYFDPKYIDKDIIDKRIHQIILSHPEQCCVVLNRQQVEALAKLNGWWVLKVDDRVMKAGQQQCLH
ncbi:hypothetical protein [Photobacterium nomapromontoriensis]|uniref:hypothetical protein n=1 Tax=Photobacterium nomapromontoriensis TaxID=2910237 RepID=UPI003D0CCAD1